MTPFGSDRPRRKLPIVLVLVGIFVAALAGVGYYFGPRLERDAPQITLAPDAGVLGRAPMEIRVADPGSGLKAVTVTLSAGGAEHTIASEQYADPVKEKTFALAASKLTGIKEGPAALRVTARDGSLWRFFGGNETVLQKELIIDITPPTVAVPTPTATPQSEIDEQTSTTNLLQLARRLHEEHVREGVEKRDALIAEGHATAARIVAEAEAKQRAQMGILDQERVALEKRVDELRVFEREYRQKLKGYIEGQLRELDSAQPVQVSGGAGFILKGGGWYSDLYSSSKPKSGDGGSSSSSTSSSTSSSSSSSSSSSDSGGSSEKKGKSESAPAA